MTVSVCMSLYNGETYIEEQLKSILNQTRQPDEVILCDDCSTDQTAEIVQRFVMQHRPKGKWIYQKNPINLGYPSCFYHAMSLCTGDIVFLADQDDIWDVCKIQRMLGVFGANPDAQVVCCKFGLIDANNNPIHSMMQPVKSKETGKIRQIAVEEIFYKYEWPGMVMAYRNRWYQENWDCNKDYGSIPHDLFICAIAAEVNGFLQMDLTLAYHRRHNNNAGHEEHRLSRLLNRDRKLKEISDYMKYLEDFNSAKVMQTEKGQKALQNKYISMKGRYDALQSGNVIEVIQNAWQNQKSTRIATALCDILITLKRGK